MPDETPRWYWLPARRRAWQQAQDEAEDRRRRDRQDAIARLRQRTSFEPSRTSSDPSSDLIMLSYMQSLTTPSRPCGPAASPASSGDSGSSGWCSSSDSSSSSSDSSDGD